MVNRLRDTPEEFSPKSICRTYRSESSGGVAGVGVGDEQRTQSSGVVMGGSTDSVFGPVVDLTH